jgi:hypothetical protein
MLARRTTLLAVLVVSLVLTSRAARAQDIDLCFATADRVAGGETVSDAEKEAGHKACQAALAATASIVQKSQIQDADYDIVGRPAPEPN